MPDYKITLAHMDCPQRKDINAPVFRTIRSLKHGKVVVMLCEACKDEVWLSSEEVVEKPEPEELCAATPQIVIP